MYKTYYTIYNKIYFDLKRSFFFLIILKEMKAFPWASGSIAGLGPCPTVPNGAIGSGSKVTVWACHMAGGKLSQNGCPTLEACQAPS